MLECMEQASPAPDLSYPIGKYDFATDVPPERRAAALRDIAALPALVRAAVAGLDEGQLDTPYRPGGWTGRQVVHHLADSHMNSFIRFKLAVTEDEPVIKPYKQPDWAATPDARTAPVELSLGLLEALHARWTVLLASLDDAGFARAFRHPEIGTVRLDMAAAMYGWHGRHHVAHITALRQRMGW
jgi:hypothetical protein